MTFKAKYAFKDGAAVYWRTIHADNLNEAIRRAESYANRGYIMLKVVQDV